MPVDPQAHGERFMRQIDIADPLKFKHQVSILGVGAIGSVAGMAAAKLGTPLGINLIDFDLFEDHNIPNQICLESAHKTKYKAAALGAFFRDMGAMGPVTPIVAKLVKGGKLEYQSIAIPGTSQDSKIGPAKDKIKGIVINTPDSMAARKILWEDVVRLNPQTPWIIDARLAGPYLLIIVANSMKMEDIRRYGETLYDDKDASLEPCGARSVIDYSLHAGAWISTIIRKIQTDQPVWREIRFDIQTGELTITLDSGELVTNREALAIAMAG